MLRAGGRVGGGRYRHRRAANVLARFSDPVRTWFETTFAAPAACPRLRAGRRSRTATTRSSSRPRARA